MDDVAGHAGVVVGTLYRHFPTKDVLLTELVREKLIRLAAAMTDALSYEGDAGEILERTLRDAALSASRDAGMQAVFSGLGPAIFSAVENEQREVNAAAGVLIDRAKRVKAVRADLEPTDIGMLMCGLGAAMHSARPGFDWSRHLDLILA